MQCTANIQNFLEKFAVRCKFYSFLYVFCSALHFYTSYLLGKAIKFSE
jgi:hypothetical protein